MIDRINPAFRGRAFWEEWGLGPEREGVLPEAWGTSKGSRWCWKPPGLCQRQHDCSCWSAKDRRKKVSFNWPRSWFRMSCSKPAPSPGGYRIADAGGCSPGGPEKRGRRGVHALQADRHLCGGGDGDHHGGRGYRIGPAGEGQSGHRRSGSTGKPEVVPEALRTRNC